MQEAGRCFSFGRSLSLAASSFTFRHIVAPTFINACGPAAADYDDYMTSRKQGGRGGRGRKGQTGDDVG